MKQVSEICLIAPTEALAATANRMIAEMGDHIDVFVSTLDSASALARELTDQGAQIFISRKGTKSNIEKALQKTVVGINTTLTDYAKYLKYVSGKRVRVGFLTFDKVADDIMVLCDMLGIDARSYHFTSNRDSEDCVRHAAADGVKIAIGGSSTERYAQEYGMEHIIIENSQESIVHAIETARQFLKLQKEEERKQEELKIRIERYETIFNYTHDAIIAVDNGGKVEVLNQIAETIINSDKRPFVGRNIDEVLENTKLLDVIKSGRQEIGRLMEINGTLVSTNRIPIVVDGKVKGAVATFQDVKTIQDSEQKIRVKMHRKGHVAKYHFSDIIGSSETMRNIKGIAVSYAQSDSTILIRGETGTGKELFAQSIHNASARRGAHFVAINCAALPRNLLEAELFGYEEGSFTGATKGGKPGLFEIAHGGTIFLDEIGEIPMETQVQLLRVLQEKEIRRIGSDRVIPVDMRIITATNRDLEAEIAQNRFRQDLFYRLNVLNLEIPPLRARREDIVDIGLSIFQKLCGPRYDACEHVLLELLQAVRQYDWPGNVRELHNFAERVWVLLSQGEDVQSIHRMGNLLIGDNAESLEVPPPASAPDSNLELWERERIIQALKENNLVLTATAATLGISRTTLWRKIKQHNIHI